MIPTGFSLYLQLRKTLDQISSPSSIDSNSHLKVTAGKLPRGKRGAPNTTGYNPK